MTEIPGELEVLRRQVDETNQKMLELLNRRKEIILNIMKLKQQHGISIFDPEREEAEMVSLKARNAGPMLDEELEEIFETIMRQAKVFRWQG